MVQSGKSLQKPVKSISRVFREQSGIERIGLADTRKKRTSRVNRIMALARASGRVWRSRLSWRMTIMVFLTIMAVQIGTVNFTSRDYEAARLRELAETARSAVMPIIREGGAESATVPAPISDDDARRVIAKTRLDGLAILDTALVKVRSYGAPVSMTLKQGEGLDKTYRSDDGKIYEIVLGPEELRQPFIMILRLDSTDVKREVSTYVNQALFTMLMLTSIVTLLMMVALGRWFLEPLFFLRDNLLKAAENPEHPNLEESPFTQKDEIGAAIEAAQSLIRQNAENIKRIKHAAEDQIYKIAYYDALTGLPNRMLFLHKLTEQIRESGKRGDLGRRFVVIVLDIGHFKDVNDSMGHNVGDGILRAVAKRLRAALTDSAIVARIGADEFAITLPLEREDTRTALQVAERIGHVIQSQPFKVFNENFQLYAAIGAAVFPDHGTDPDQVLKNADIALNRAKDEGRTNIEEYSLAFEKVVTQRFQMLRDLRTALESNQLLVYFQPQLDLRSGRVIGAEALLRWWQPRDDEDGGGFISPAEFVPVAEQSGLIVPIGEWVMQAACEEAAEWGRRGFPLRIAVNVSGVQFHQTDIAVTIRKTLQKTGLSVNRLELEVTESVFMDDIKQTIGLLQRLQDLGVELAIDDFGTGYSSLSYLRQFPVDRLKIDRSFITNVADNHDDASIARTIIRLAHSLNLKVIAEGVETKQQEMFLKTEGCDEVQGYRYSKPLPPEDFITFLQYYDGNISSFDGRR